MALFSKADAETTIQKAIDAERSVRDQLEARLVAARKSATDCQSAARKATRDLATDAELDKVEQKQIAAEHRATNLSLELADATAKLAELEAQLVSAADQRIRRATVAEIEQIAARFATATANADAALGELADVTAIMSRFMLDAHGLAGFALAAKNELPSPVGILTALLKSYAAGVLNGTERATLPKPEIVTRQPIQAPPPVVRVYLTKDVCWTDANGALQTWQRFTDCDLPPPIAARALKLNAATTLDSDIRKKRSGIARHIKPKPEDCTSLDDTPFQSDSRVTPPIMFEARDRGGPRVVAIPAAAARNLKEK